MQQKETIIISLGGSIVIPENPDKEFLIKFKNLIEDNLKKGKRFFIVVGGGKISRIYQNSLKDIVNASKEDLDLMGISVTRTNAELLRLVFKDHAPREIVTDPSIVPTLQNDVVIGAGWEPGCSTDTDTILIAQKLGIKKIVNLSNIDYIYDSDPRLNPNAKKLENISWNEYMSMVGNKWNPGMNLPFDPVASQIAQKEGIEVVFISGKNLENFKDYLDQKSFIGSTIK